MSNKVTFEEDIIIFKEKEEQSAPEYDPTKYIFTEDGTKSDMELYKGSPLATRKIFGLVRPGAGLDILENGVLVLNFGFGFTIDPITKKLILSAEIVPLAGNNIDVTLSPEGEYTISVVGETEVLPTSKKVPTSQAIATFTEARTGNVSNIIPALTVGVNNNLTNAVNTLYTQSHYYHTQISPEATWIINHPLKKKPSVTITTEDNVTVLGEVEYPSLDQVIVRFSAGFSGSAFLN